MLSHHHRRSRGGFTVIEIVVVFIIIALMLVIIVPHFVLEVKARKAARVKADVAALNSALEHFALDNGKTAGYDASYADIRKYLNPQSDAYKLNGQDLLGDQFGPYVVGTRITVPLPTQEKLSSVTPREYWSPYQ
ncbi:MAG TPA: prepilin-type cleavage/methylation domain-containing protein [Chthoniobacteraceae bacterium]|jgi:type II secretory pathway pseudopilin PulG|nr:prepilin-type cleavage/methylation domain-containing protein [Chthoniobacteraceae bacterium]